MRSLSYVARDPAAGWRRADPLGVVTINGGVEAVDLSSGAMLWRSTLRPGAPLAVRGISTTRTEVVVLIDASDGNPREVVSLSREDGHILWRAPRHSGLDEILRTGGTTVLRLEEDGASWHAVDAASGAELWRLPTTRTRPVAAANDKYAILGGIAENTAVVVNLRTGRETGRQVLAGPMVDAAVGEDRAVVTVHPTGKDGVQLVGLSLPAAEVLWPTGAARGRTEGTFLNRPQVLVHGDLAFLNGQGLLRIYDAASGERLWEYAVGEDAWMGYDDTSLVAVRRREDTLGVVYATPTAFYIFEPGATPPVSEGVHIRGAVTADGNPVGGVQVYAHGVAAVTAEDGTYSISVTAHGAISLSPVVGNRPYSRRLVLDGRREYRVDLEAISECVENCEP
jgi:outer membrane protein assembly factor BamB